MQDVKEKNKKHHQWQMENRERINILLPKGTKERLTKAADKHNIGLSEYMRRALEAALAKDEIDKNTR